VRILLTSRLTYLPALSGASKADRRLVEGLARRGHHCRVVIPAHSPASKTSALAGGDRQFLAELAHRAIDVREGGPGRHRFNYNGVEVDAVIDAHRLDSVLVDQIREFEPDWILVSEDRSYVCLAAALDASASRVIHLCHSQATLPFGPESFATDTGNGALLRRAAGIVTVSHYVKDYLARWAGLDATVIQFPVYGQAPFELRGRFDQGCVTLVNPSQIKGIEIFQQLARARPDVEFAAVPTWATRDSDRRALQRLLNVQVLEPSEDIEDIFARTRVLLMPSLWGEAFGYLSVEAMLRGIPVLASKLGGLPEAKLGVDYLLPVRPVERYEERLDECLLPIPVVPEQDLAPWLAALDELLSNRASYERLSAASRRAALAFVATVDVAQFEGYLERLGEGRTAPASQREQAFQRPDDALPGEAGKLSVARLELLNLLLRKQR
jgi:glycosyltransferase involved in cell wall biosynthesis